MVFSIRSTLTAAEVYANNLTQFTSIPALEQEKSDKNNKCKLCGESLNITSDAKKLTINSGTLTIFTKNNNQSIIISTSQSFFSHFMCLAAYILNEGFKKQKL